MTGEILADEVDHFPDALQPVRESGRAVIPFSPARLAKFARGAVSARIGRRRGVTAIAAAFDRKKLGAVLLAHQHAAVTRERFAFDLVLDVVNDDKLSDQIRPNAERERILRI